ncbi:thiosulfate/3-mercaptopyruvate sulfurtransferase [Motilibacter rhizosphaerae]|uniref:Thiosulfate/3-mercaptopyruvate sulfurtransferase n=1 Tax=Motilibacter rhizosphaerae TaxID=598652 RepID=A0A4Q7NSG9_9ACTN|nr:sulfurtransferase [Motilibacter rhizosphaerae]RZS90076.1 thiosulfate/3-mercaptopyruvate sulfurtransferase [Motilibacter rhizosphaerae]
MIPPVVDLAWLQALPDGQASVLADVRHYLDGRDARAAFDTAHLPGAVFVDLERWLAGPASPEEGRHPLPDPAVFAEGLAQLGIAPGTVVVAYDDAGGVMAARLVWMLRVLGEPAALLDGGLTAYTGPLERDEQPRTPVDVPVRPWPPEALAELDEVARLGAGTVLLDARQAERYRGEVETVDPRAGHIPGARSLPCRENLDPSGRFLPVEQLRARFAAVGVDGTGDVVSSCGSGVTACHTLLALEHAGLGTGRLYVGSWSQWSADPARPGATGEQP